MSNRSADKVKIASYDDLFGEKTVSKECGDQVIRMPLQKLRTPKNHPFRVLDDEKMSETAESIKRYGVLVPGIARYNQQNECELVSGNRRKRGCELAGIPDMPVIIRMLTDDEATIIMVDSNIQREDILPSEKAWAYRLKMEAIKHQGSKGERFTADIVGEAAGESGRTVQRYIRLTYLKQELLEYVDEKKLQMMAGEQLSFLTAEEQEWVYNAIEDRGIFPSKEQAETLKAESETKTLTVSRVAGILVKAERMPGITIPVLQIRSYFPQDYTKAQMETIIFQLLNAWKEKQDMEVQT